ncbi:MAG: hypothetical protein EZS28_003024 [Streblomastix strix]|uniref:Uncharacterized protein n=1 Tax=Streblomastix strix TaxID=222440 RepID=A0A5J4X2L8_9EUKA|nr:MAG: hypothetical protein EZS28_003024 [Streblomastix strix]
MNVFLIANSPYPRRNDELTKIGVSDIDGVSNIAASHRSSGISVSTVRLGLDNSEELMSEEAQKEIITSILGQISNGGRNQVQQFIHVAEIIITSETDEVKTKTIKKIKQHDKSVVETILSAHSQHLLQIQHVITIPQDKLIQIQQQYDVGMNSFSAVSLRTRYIVDTLALYKLTRTLKDDIPQKEIKDITSSEQKSYRLQQIPLDQQQSSVQVTINNILLKQQENLDEVEVQLVAAENDSDLKNHYEKLFDMQNFVDFSDQDSAPMIAMMASSSRAQPDLDEIYPNMEL